MKAGRPPFQPASLRNDGGSFRSASRKIWVGSVPYYYANDVYYVQGPQGYTVVAPPASNTVVETPPPASNVAQAPQEQLFIYPKQGQSEQQQATDRYECHRWAVSQTGYDPTLSPAPAPPQKQEEYRRAMSACLDGRGYTVK